MEIRKPVALIADDDPDCLELLETHLSRLGFAVRTANTQAEAEQEIGRAAPDIAFFDLMMEHSDSGFVLAHLCKRSHPGVPVVLVTSVAAATGIRFSGVASPWIMADKVLDKGIRFEQLEKEVRRLLPERSHSHV